MLALAIAESAAEARSEIEAVMGFRSGSAGSSREGGLAVSVDAERLTLQANVQADGFFASDVVDCKLWKGAADSGWRMQPKSIRGYLCGLSSNYRYISPSGVCFSSRKAAHQSTERLGHDGNEDEMVVEVVDADSDDDGDVEPGEGQAVLQVELLDEARPGDSAHHPPGSGVSSAFSRAAQARATHEAAAAAVLAAREGESSDYSEDDDSNGPRERCIIWGCRRQLLRCYGYKPEAGQVIGCAESAHVVCASCLTRWWDAQNQLYHQRQMGPVLRKVCPCCRSELRQTNETRADSEHYHLGLLKVPGTW